MKSKGIKISAMFVCFVMFFQSTAQAASQVASLVQINIPSLTLTLYSGNKVIKKYPIAAGMPGKDTQTVRGNYSIIERLKNPTYVSTTDKTVMPPGEGNPLGDRWLRVTGNYGIHGNAAAYSIGTFASHGCMRMYNWDITEVFDAVKLGTKVSIGYQTTEEYPNVKYKNASAIIVHPDEYNLNTNNYTNIMKRAKALGISISAAKQKTIKSSLNYKTVSFAEGWSVLVNNKFVTADTFVYDQKGTKLVPDVVKETVTSSVYGNTYENKTIYKTVPTHQSIAYGQMDTLCNYFGINFKREKDSITLVNVPGAPHVKILSKNKKYYVPLVDFSNAIGKDYNNIDNDLQMFNMNVYYVKHKDKFITSDVKMVYYKMYIGLNSFVSKMGLTKKLKSTNKGYTINNKLVTGQWANNKFYADVDSLKNAVGEAADYSSYKKCINFL